MPHLSRFLSGLALMLTLPLSGCLDTGPDVVCVDVERVLSQSKAARQANEHLGKVQTILQNGLAAYQEELKKSPEEKRQQELRQGLALLQRQMALEQAAARDVVSKHMLAQIEAWRADKGDVAVMARQNVLSAPASMDITAEIISRNVEYIPLLQPVKAPDGKKIRGFYFDYSRIYRNKPDDVTFKRKRTWQFNNLKPREYK